MPDEEYSPSQDWEAWLDKYKEYWRGNLTAGDYAALENNISYLTNVEQIYRGYLEQGFINEDMFNTTMVNLKEQSSPQGFGSWRSIPTVPTTAPFYKQLLGNGPLEGAKWVVEQRAALQKQKESRGITQVARQTTAQNYLPQLQEYLDDAISKGLEQEVADQIYQAEAQLISQGASTSDLPNSTRVKDFQTLGPPATPSKQQVAKWTKNNWIYNPDETLTPREQAKEKYALAEYKRNTFVEQWSNQRQEDYYKSRNQVNPQGTMGSADQLQMQKRRQESDIWEMGKQQLLSQLTSDDKWIDWWQVKNMENRFAYGGALQERDIEESAIRSQPEAIWKAWEAEKTAPPSPEWMKAFSPGQVTGQPLVKKPLVAPSGQLLSTTTPSQLRKLSGYADWAGGESLEDLLSRTQSMLPQQPFGRNSWKPARQRG